MIHNILDARTSVSGDQPLQLYVVSIHYRSLDAAMTSCPPLDWQSPPLIDSYNTALAKACQDSGGANRNVTFVDTRRLVNPTWDFSEKSSPVGRENRHGLEAESMYLARAVLGLDVSGLESSSVLEERRTL